jgi:hypothetical protein
MCVWAAYVRVGAARAYDYLLAAVSEFSAAPAVPTTLHTHAFTPSSEMTNE